MCHLTLSWLLFSSIMSSMLKRHLCDFSRPIRLFLGSFLWRLLPNAHSTLPLKCFYECEHLHNRALVSVLATGRNSTNFLYKERDPCAFVNDMDNKNFSLFSNSHSKDEKETVFFFFTLMFVTTKNHWLAKLRLTENWSEVRRGFCTMELMTNLNGINMIENDACILNIQKLSNPFFWRTHRMKISDFLTKTLKSQLKSFQI